MTTNIDARREVSEASPPGTVGPLSPDERLSTAETITTGVQWLNEPAVVLAGYLALWLMIRLTPGLLARNYLAGALALFGSGFSLVTVLYPRRDVLDSVERLALSGLFSLALGGIAGFILVHTATGLTLNSALVAMVLFNAACYGAVLWRRRGWAAYEAPVRMPWEAFGQWFNNQGPTGLLVAGALLVALMAGAGAVVQAARMPVADPPMTEFYLADANNQVEDLPETAAPGQMLSFGYGVNNQEHAPGQYQVLALVDGRLVGNSGAFRLESGQDQQGQVQITVPSQQTLGQTRIDIVLFRDGKRYRVLYLWVNVASTGK